MTGHVQALRVPINGLTIPHAEILRYMGAAGAADPALDALIARELESFCAAAKPTAVFMEAEVSMAPEGVSVGGLFAPGKALARHLAGCTSAILFAATVGSGSEALARRAAVISPARALALDAIGATAIESVCDFLCARWRDERPGAALRPRFSPGYADLPLGLQRPMLNMLDAGRKAGITLTASLMMLPQKSVTAIVGIGPGGCTSTHEPRGCEACPNTVCQFRK